jgi:hypothetical protein
MEEARIKKVGVLSVANLSGMVNFFIGLLLGIIFAVTSLLVPTASAIIGFGIPTYLSVIILPIGYGIMGFIGGAIGAFFYNLSARVTKGIVLYSD